MSETATPDAPVTETPATPEPADPWTSTSADPDTGAVTITEPEPTPTEPVAAEPVSDRDEAGKFKPKGTKRSNPYEAVKAATGETLKERELRQAAETRAADLERRLAALEKPKAAEPAPQAAATRPKPTEDEIGSKYATYGDFVEDLADWKAEQRASKDDLDTRIAAHFERQQQQQAMHAHARGIVSKGQAAYRDYDAVVGASDIEIPDAVKYAILNTPGSEHAVYAMAKDPELAKRIVAIDNPYVLGLEFAQLVSSSAAGARPDSASMTRPSSAKPPINRVGGTASAMPVDPDDLDFGPDYIRAENERERKRQQANRV